MTLTSGAVKSSETSIIVSCVSLPQRSKAVYILKLASPSPQGFGISVSVKRSDANVQLSSAVTPSSIGSSIQATSGKPLITGGVSSIKIAVNVNSEGLSQPSVTSHSKVLASIKPHSSQSVARIDSIVKSIEPRPLWSMKPIVCSSIPSINAGNPPFSHLNTNESPFEITIPTGNSGSN